jgi:uncharacterized protein (TIGR02145 family)
MINQRIKDYQIIRKIGEGGMASVFLAQHVLLGTQVALKILNQEFVRNTNIRNRFLAEARNMAKMQHPNIVKVTDLIDAGDVVAIAMEYIEGETLKDYLNRQGNLTDKEIATLLGQMLDALDYVHQNRLVHRDVKPSNFMRSNDGMVKLLDFGIAKNLDAASSDYTSTGTTQQMGTIMYMSPEQVKSTKDVTPATDIYSLGVVLWQMVKGYAPYNPSTSGNFDIQSKIVHESLPLTNTKWDAVIQKATAKVEEERYIGSRDFRIQMDDLFIHVPLAAVVHQLDKTIIDNGNTTAHVSYDSSFKNNKKWKKIFLFLFCLIILIFGFVSINIVKGYNTGSESKEELIDEENIKNINVKEDNTRLERVNSERKITLEPKTDGFNKTEECQENLTRKAIDIILSDVDGNIYKVANIGDQLWMLENLNVSRFRNGDEIRNAKTKEEWKYCADNKIPAWCYYDNNLKIGKKYGKLYNWYAVTDKRGISPIGWRVTSIEDWEIFKNLIKTSETYLLPSGQRWDYSGFNGIDEWGWYWTSQELEKNSKYGREMYYFRDIFSIEGHWEKETGMAIRCVKD